MTSRATRRLAAAALLGAIACGGSDEGADEAFPSRDWSGVYALGVSESSTDCAGAEAPPPLGDLVLEVDQSIDNQATVAIGPLVSLSGRFDGDELEARGVISQPIPLPDSLLARAGPGDSLETIVYRLEATFANDSLSGRYGIRAPDLVALARGGDDRRCSYEYEVRGASLLEAPAASIPPASRGSAGPR